MNSFTLTLWTGPFQIEGVPFIIIIFCRNVNLMQTVDPDQTPRTAASDLGLQVLPNVPFMDARLKWVKD